MRVSLTIKGLPAAVNEALNHSAVAERRSKNAQTIVWLEERARQLHQRLPEQELQRRLRALRKVWKTPLTSAEREQWIKEGRR